MPARQLVRVGVLAALEADQFEQLARRRPALARARRRRPASGSSTFCSAVRHGSSAASWNTKPMSRRSRAACGAAPSTLISPRLGWIRSATTRRNVDLPQPDGPSSVRNSPAATSRLRPSIAVTLRRSVKKRTPMLRQLIDRSCLAASASGEPAAPRAADSCGRFMRYTLGERLVALRTSIVMTSSTFGVLAR